MNEIYEVIKDILVNNMDVEGEVNEDTSFEAELDIDSIEMVELGKNLNERLGTHLTSHEVMECDNMRELADCIQMVKEA